MPENVNLIALAGGRAYTLDLAGNTSLEEAMVYLTREEHAGRGGFPDTALTGDWFETREGFRIRKGAVDAYVIGHKQGDWAKAGPPE